MKMNGIRVVEMRSIFILINIVNFTLKRKLSF
jgi:hypothetical protein